ncbi:MAG: tagG 3 [Acidobacteria bacterium]|nr:tagG 3 [Acidobacteriota bacterium]
MTRGSVFAGLYGQRGLLQVLVARELKARYRGTLFGYFWSLLNPLLLLAVYTAVFTLVIPARVASPVPYPLFLFAGLLPWLFASGSLLDGAVVLHDNGPLLKKVMCPPEVFPAVTVLAHLVHHLLALPVLLVAMAAAALAGAMTFPWTVVLLPVAIVLWLVTVPVTPLVTLYRDLALHGRLPAASTWGWALLVALVCWSFGAWLFARLREGLAEAV